MLKSLHTVTSAQQPFSLSRWFSVLSLICITTTCVVSSYLLSRYLTEQMLHRDGVVMLEFIQSVADIENAKARAAGREPDVRDPGMHELFEHLVGVPNILRSNIYAPDQTLAWSSEKELIGKRFNDNHELEQALKGELEIESGTTGRSEHPKHEHMFLSARPVQFVETYIPLRDTKSNRVIGVAELYRIPTALFDTIDMGHRLIWATGILSGLLLYGMLFWAVRRADNTISSQQARLVESETLAVVGEMGSAVAHGIRNPLASIRSSAELCLDDQASPQARESASDIMAQVDRLEKWIRDLLSYAQPEPDVTGRISLDKVIHRVCSHLARDFEKVGIVPSIDLPWNLPDVVGEDAAVEQVFSSILANAVEAMPKGGKLDVFAYWPSRNAPVTVTVSDTGVGMSDAQKARLFTAFQTSKPKGMGLGLALVRRIIRRHGGDIQIDSAVGKGTQVRLTFTTGVHA